VTTAELFRLLPDHRPRFVGLDLACRCGEPLTRGHHSVRAHLFGIKNAEGEARRAAIAAEWREVTEAVERDRRDIAHRSLTAAQFAFACGISSSAAKRWLWRRGLDWARNKRAVAA